MLGFRGTAKNHLNKVRSVNSDAYLTYGRSSGLALEWCVAYNSTASIFDHITDASLSDNDKNELWKIAHTAVSQGLEKIGESFQILNDVKQRRDELHQELERMHVDFIQDLSSTGTYEQDNERVIAQDVAFFRKLVSDIGSGFSSRGIESSFASAAESCLATTFAGIKANRKDKLSRVIAGLHPIGAKIKTAAKLASIPEFDLKEDRTNIDALKERIRQEGAVSAWT